MAEVNTGGGGGGKGKGGKVRSKKQSTKIDMTPMVDLAFLLLTFFMLTTTFSKPQTMEIVMPDKEKDIKEEEQTKVKASQAMTVVLGEGDKIFYYYGIDDPNQQAQVQTTNFGKDGIRAELFKRLKQEPKTFVLIKAQEKSKYKNVVDILDEMNITNVGSYAIVDYTPEDEEFLKANNITG